MPDEPVPLSELERDLGAPAAGWAAELARRGVAVVTDDLGREAVDRATARVLFAEHREQEKAVARKAAEVERRAIAADREFRSRLWGGLSADQLPIGVSPATAMFAADRELTPRRRTPLEDALAGDGTVFHPLVPDRADQ